MRASRGRKLGIGALLVVATIVAILGMTAVWVQRQILDRDEWVETSVDLLEDEHIRQAVGLYLIDELYTNVDVGAQLEERLPPRLKKLAEPAAAALRRGRRTTRGRCSARLRRSSSGGRPTSARTTSSRR